MDKEFKLARENASEGWYESRYMSMYDIVKDTVNPANQIQLDESLDGEGIHGPLRWLGTASVSGRRAFANHVENTGTFDDISAAVVKRVDMLPEIAPGLPRSIGQIVKRHRRRDSFGDHVDIHAVNQGLLDVAWTRTERHIELASKTRVARIYVHIGGLMDDRADDSFWRAATTIKIADALTSKGFSVEITGGATAESVFQCHTNWLVHTVFTVKASGMPLNRERLACQATLGWHRIFVFKARCCTPYKVRASFGVTKYDAVPPFIEEAREKGELVIVIPASVHNKSAAEGCLANARAELEKYTANTHRPAMRA